MTLWERFKYTIVKPDDEPEGAAPQEERAVDEVREEVRRANDKERAIGLIAAPLAAAIGFVIISALIDHDPAKGAKNYVDPSLYHELLFVLLGLAVLVLVSALWRKRLFLGITVALYGLAVFNLHYWGFGVPFVLVGAWYLVRAYRLQQELKRVEGAGGTGGTGGRAKSTGSSNGARPRPNKRYTPPR